MYRGAVRLNLIAAATLASAACAGPIAQVGTVSLDDVRAEQLQQQQLAARTSLLARQRVDRVAAPLLRAAAPLCGQDVRVATRTSIAGETESVATSTADTLCAFTVAVEPDDAVDAHADGRSILVSSAMLRFANDEELSVVLAHELAHNALRHAAAVKAMAYSQDLEREADYVGLYILAWAGRSIDDGAQLWRRLAVEHPAEITFTRTHPTTAERFVRLEQWRSEINRKIASGMDFGPEMRDQRFAVVSRAAVPAELSAPTAVAMKAPVAARSAPSVQSEALVHLQGDVRETPPATRSDMRQSSVMLELPMGDGIFARATIGAPLSEADRAAAVPAYQQAVEFLGSRRWGQAKVKLREALRYDGSVAAYHAAMGEVLEVEKNWAGAAAEYTAALLLDVDNMTYRVRLKEARLQF